MKNVKTSCVKSLLKIHCASGREGEEGGGRGGGLPMMAYTRRLCPKGYLQFRLKVYERVGISLVEVYLTIIPRARVGSESKAHEAKDRVGY